ncbi:MAG: TIGR04255 family protein [Chloroflexi bacterium]|nr:TIGR04255 family protein [Chloroflexota bacterium]
MHFQNLFSDVERVIYRNNPLQSVICQLMFPPILSIESALPAAFQDKIRSDFPLFQAAAESDDIPLPPAIAELIPQDLRQVLIASDRRRYQFLSKDKNWTITLARDFVALQTRTYRRWEDFREHLEKMVHALISVYAPDSISRLGLRYQNAIDRNAMELANVPWRDLIAPQVLGPLGLPDYEPEIVEQNGVFSLSMNAAGDFIRVSHGLAHASESQDSDLVFLLDNDLFTSDEVPAEVNNVISRASEFNILNRNFFRWCILDPLHTAMGPEPAT